MSAQLALKSGHIVLVDDADLAAVLAAGPWCIKRDGRNIYARHMVTAASGVGRREETLHRFLTDWPMVDHINGNGLDNRRANLRSATNAENMANRHAVTSRSGFKGVTYHKQARRWQAAIQHRYIGLFATPEAAARAYDREAVRTFGAFACTNFPYAEQVAA